jgi:hypothetical protein
MLLINNLEFETTLSNYRIQNNIQKEISFFGYREGFTYHVVLMINNSNLQQ